MHVFQVHHYQVYYTVENKNISFLNEIFETFVVVSNVTLKIR